MSINRSGETIVELATQSRKSFDFTSFVGYLMFLLEVFAAAKIIIKKHTINTKIMQLQVKLQNPQSVRLLFKCN